MKYKFTGPPNPGPDGEDAGHDVVVRGQFVGNVKSGEVIDVPDELCAGTDDDPAPVFAESLYEPVTEVAAAKKKSDGEV